MERTFLVGDDLYAIQHERKLNINTLVSGLDLQPCLPGSTLRLASVITPRTKKFKDEDLAQLAALYAGLDDVWVPRFLDLLIIRGHDTSMVRLDDDRQFVMAEAPASSLPDGPYVVEAATGDVYPIYRLVPDKYEAFIGGCIPCRSTPDSFELLPTDHIAVPSRLYSDRSTEKPLAGLRFAIKDLIDVAGLKTGCGSRCFYSVVSAKTTSAPFVDYLLRAGAVLVGKTKTTQFADGQEPSEWFDYIAPFNPRGDGYQKPSSSSSGSAAAVAAYEWLDFAIGTDTGGSIRHPAGINGIFGTRPSLGAINSTGFCASPLLDTVGVLARSASNIQLISNVMSPQLSLTADIAGGRSRYKVLIPVRSKTSEADRKWFPYPGTSGDGQEAEALFDSFVQKIEKHVNCERITFNIDDLWRETRPTGQPDSLHEATGTIYQIVAYHTYVKETMDPFIADYQAANSGRKPFLDPIVRRRQEWVRQISIGQYEAAVASLHMFSQWVRETIFKTSDDFEVPLVIFPQTWGTPDYRDRHPDPSAELFWSKFSPYSLSYCSGCPDFTIPIGEVAYYSRITDRQEWLPLSLSILSKPGLDNVLLKLLEELQKESVLPPVAVGSRLYP